MAPGRKARRPRPAIVAPEARFGEVLAAAEPTIEAIEFHALKAPSAVVVNANLGELSEQF